MSIYARCCGKDHKITKRKCITCGKKMKKYVVRVRCTASKRWKTKTVNSLKFAKEIESKFKIEMIQGELFNIKRVGIIDFDIYLKNVKPYKKTWKMDRCRWNVHVKENDFKSRKGILNIMAAMKEKGRADATIHHVLKLIHRVYNWSIDNGYYYGENPCKTIKAPTYDNRVTEYLSKDEVNYLLKQLDLWDNFRAVNIIKFALYTGRRRGEILNLLWSDIDIDNKTITCRNTKNGKTISFPLNGKAFEIILNAQKKKISDYVFPSTTGDYYYNGLGLAWKRFKKRINLNYRFHDLRHTYASHLASSGKVDIYTLKTLLGHQDINLTMRYAHLSNNTVKNANNVIDDIF